MKKTFKTNLTKDNIYKKLCKICPTKRDQSLKNYCTIKIGGSAKYVCFARTVRQVKKLVKFLKKVKLKYYIVGNGSNIVFEDSGFNGVIICLKQLKRIYAGKKYVCAYAGANLFALNNFCMANGYGGLEFSYGIPASVGGAVVMNAGAYGGQMSDVVKYVWVLSGGQVKRLSKFGFDYRHSVFLHSNMIVLKVAFELYKAEPEKIKALQKQIFTKRLISQPYGTLNSGSVFKRAGEGAGKIIDKMGLKGVTIGDIQISPKHANFFVNLGNATSKQLHQAIALTKQTVKAGVGINLQQEIIFVGD